MTLTARERSGGLVENDLLKRTVLLNTGIPYLHPHVLCVKCRRIVDPAHHMPPLEASGTSDRFPYTHPNDDFVQAAALYGRVMSDEDREHLVANIVDHLGAAQARLQKRQTAVCYRVDPGYGNRIARGLGLDLPEIKSVAATSDEERARETMP